MNLIYYNFYEKFQNKVNVRKLYRKYLFISSRLGWRNFEVKFKVEICNLLIRFSLKIDFEILVFTLQSKVEKLIFLLKILTDLGISKITKSS